MTDPSDSTAAPEIHRLPASERPAPGTPLFAPLADLAAAPGAPGLQRLYTAFRAAEVRVDACARRVNRLAEITPSVEAPEALFVRRGDHLSIHLAAKRSFGGRRFYGVNAVIEELRGRDLVDFGGRPSAADRRRRDEIVAAYEGWCAACDAAREASGLLAVQAELADAMADLAGLRDAILVTPAADIDDLVVKAAVVAIFAVGPEEDGVVASEDLLAQHRDRAFQENYGAPYREWQLAAALLADLARLAEARGLLPGRSPASGRSAVA